MTIGGTNLGGEDRVGLLSAIDAHGSITQAARAIGISYKAAWDAVDAMNNLAGDALVERSTGGRGGGSTKLTPRGLKLIERYAQIATLHQRFVQLLSNEAADLGAELNLLRILNMKTSARNQFAGTVSALKMGAVNDEVELTLPGGSKIVAIVTRESTESLSLKPGTAAFALIKASSVIVATDLEGAILSTRNQLAGKVVALTPGAVNAEVIIELDGGGTIAAIVTQSSVGTLGLHEGCRAMALFKASSVILATQV